MNTIYTKIQLFIAILQYTIYINNIYILINKQMSHSSLSLSVMTKTHPTEIPLYISSVSLFLCSGCCRFVGLFLYEPHAFSLIMLPVKKLLIVYEFSTLRVH